MSINKKAFVIIGMAGSGKSTFAQRLNSWLEGKAYTINLDPAILTTKIKNDEDIRDTVNYKESMVKYNLGPNGAIITCLNIYLLNVQEKLKNIKNEYIIIDTPGQIEAFTWSSPGNVLIESLKGLGWSVHLLYTIDSCYSLNPSVFMSNMIYLASLMSKFKTRGLAVFNKIDLVECDTLIKWLKDYESFIGSLDRNDMTTTVYQSLALYFEEFYKLINTVQVSASMGYGKEEFFKEIERCEYKEVLAGKTVLETEEVQ